MLVVVVTPGRRRCSAGSPACASTARSTAPDWVADPRPASGGGRGPGPILSSGHTRVAALGKGTSCPHAVTAGAVRSPARTLLGAAARRSRGRPRRRAAAVCGTWRLVLPQARARAPTSTTGPLVPALEVYAYPVPHLGEQGPEPSTSGPARARGPRRHHSPARRAVHATARDDLGRWKRCRLRHVITQCATPGW